MSSQVDHCREGCNRGGGARSQDRPRCLLCLLSHPEVFVPINFCCVILTAMFLSRNWLNWLFSSVKSLLLDGDTPQTQRLFPKLGLQLDVLKLTLALISHINFIEQPWPYVRIHVKSLLGQPKSNKPIFMCLN